MCSKGFPVFLPVDFRERVRGIQQGSWASSVHLSCLNQSCSI